MSVVCRSRSSGRTALPETEAIESAVFTFGDDQSTVAAGVKKQEPDPEGDRIGPMVRLRAHSGINIHVPQRFVSNALSLGRPA